MKNTLGDLNLHLFAQLERLGDEDIVEEKLTEEIKRAEAISKIASQIIANGTLVLKAQVAYNGDGRTVVEKDKPKMLEG
jgi:hypothetical protein